MYYDLFTNALDFYTVWSTGNSVPRTGKATSILPNIALTILNQSLVRNKAAVSGKRSRLSTTDLE